MRELPELNLNERGMPVQRSAPSRELIQAFQTYFRVELPDEYLHLLRYSNGGHPELDSIQPIGSCGTAWWSVDHFYHLDADDSSAASLWVAMERWRPILGATAIPFAADGGGNQFFLDLSVSPPTVKVCVHDECCSTVDLAPSFGAFIDALARHPDME